MFTNMYNKNIYFCTEFHIYFSTCLAIIFSRRLTRAGDNLDEALFGAKKVKLMTITTVMVELMMITTVMVTKIETMQLMVITAVITIVTAAVVIRL